MPDTAKLKSLHTALIDAESGYETAIADAQQPDVKALFERMAALHRQAHSDVHKVLIEDGERPDDSGSFMGTVHKTVISVRSAVAGLDRNALPSFADGEERILQSYDEALAEATPAQAQTLNRHREALAMAIGRIRAMAA